MTARLWHSFDSCWCCLSLATRADQQFRSWDTLYRYLFLLFWDSHMLPKVAFRPPWLPPIPGPPAPPLRCYVTCAQPYQPYLPFWFGAIPWKLPHWTQISFQSDSFLVWEYLQFELNRDICCLHFSSSSGFIHVPALSLTSEGNWGMGEWSALRTKLRTVQLPHLGTLLSSTWLCSYHLYLTHKERSIIR